MKNRFVIITLGILAAVALSLQSGCAKKIIIPDFQTAKEQYQFALKEKKGTLISLKEAGRKEQLARLETAFMKVIKQFPDDMQYTPVAYISLADTYLKFRQPKKALETLELAVDKYPGQADVQLFGHYGLATAYELLKRYAEASREYKYCIDKFGDTQNPEFKKYVDLARRNYARAHEVK